MSINSLTTWWRCEKYKKTLKPILTHRFFKYLEEEEERKGEGGNEGGEEEGRQTPTPLRHVDTKV